MRVDQGTVWYKCIPAIGMLDSDLSRKKEAKNFKDIYFSGNLYQNNILFEGGGSDISEEFLDVSRIAHGVSNEFYSQCVPKILISGILDGFEKCG